MTEPEWLGATDPTPMLEFVRPTASDRRRWLFCVACYRRVWAALHARVRQAVETSERYADGRATDADMLVYNTRISLSESVRYAVLGGQKWAGDSKAEAEAQCDLLREVFGNPFRPVTIDPNWLTSDVLALATGIYDERAFDRMPILHDALLDAGCTSEEVLAHCRQPDGHCRGCWVIDLLLGKG
jgi:hypothetical protein